MSNIPIDNSNIEDRHNLELYVKHKLSSVNKLENVMIYCRNKNNEGEQIIITFFKKYLYHICLNMKVIFFKNYIKTHEDFKTISNYGDTEKIVFNLLIHSLNLYLVDGFKYTYMIGISIFKASDSIHLPLTIMEYTIDKRLPDYNKYCPICYDSWNEKKKYDLLCGHSVCRECFNNLIYQADIEGSCADHLKCPVCRDTIIQ